jgi:hypothetical protein
METQKIDEQRAQFLNVQGYYQRRYVHVLETEGSVPAEWYFQNAELFGKAALQYPHSSLSTDELYNCPFAQLYPELFGGCWTQDCIFHRVRTIVSSLNHASEYTRLENATMKGHYHAVAEQLELELQQMELGRLSVVDFLQRHQLKAA